MALIIFSFVIFRLPAAIRNSSVLPRNTAITSNNRKPSMIFLRPATLFVYFARSFATCCARQVHRFSAFAALQFRRFRGSSAGSSKISRNTRWMAFALLAVCFVAGSFPQWIQWTFDRIGSIAQVLGYGHYYRLFINNNLEYAFRNVMGPARLCPLLTCLLIIWYYPAIRQQFASDKYLPALFRFSVVYMCYINLLANTTQYLTRPGELMRSCFLVMTCFLLHHLWTHRRWIPFAAAAFFNFYYVYYELAKAYFHGGSIYAPELYHTFLF